MQIETKYSIGNTVWAVDQNGQSTKYIVKQIDVCVKSKEELKPGKRESMVKTGNLLVDTIEIAYQLEGVPVPLLVKTSETKVFSTKEECLRYVSKA